MMEPTYLKIYCFQDLELLPSFSHSLQASFFYFTKVYLCFCLIKVRMLFYCNLDHFYPKPFRDRFLAQACSNLLAFSTLMLGGKKHRFVDFKFDQYFVSLKCLLGLFKGFPQPSLFLSKQSDSIKKSNFY